MAVFVGSPTATDQRTLATQRPQFNTQDGWVITHGRWTHTATQGAGTGEINMVTLPAGKKQVNAAASWVKTSGTAFTATSDLHIGFRAYRDPSLDTAAQSIAEDDNYFADNLDVGGGALDQAWPLPTTGIVTINSAGLFHIYTMIDTADITVGAIVDVWVVWRPIS